MNELEPMSTDAYDQIVNYFSTMTPDRQRQLVQELNNAIVEAPAIPPRRSILELRGLGKDVWRGVDPAAYVREERESWRG